jgi:alpha-acetolactate decarboxylase
VALMNRKARQFGLTDVAFVNSSGLNNADLSGNHPEGTGRTDDTRLSCRSMATIAYRLLNDYPEYTEYSSLAQKVIREGQADEIVINSTNKILPGKVYEVAGARGLKTGYTNNAGYCFAGYAVRDSGRFLSVVMGAPTTADRFKGAGNLLEYGFALAEGRESLPSADASAAAGGEGSGAGAAAGAAYLYPDGLSLYSKGAFAAQAGLAGDALGTRFLATFGETGFGVMENGKADVLCVNGSLYCVSRWGYASLLDDASGVGQAVVTFFNRERTYELADEGLSLSALEQRLAGWAAEGAGGGGAGGAGAVCCFKITGAFEPKTASTLHAGAQVMAQAGSGKGVVVGFYNPGPASGLLREGFTLYYVDQGKKSAGVLVDAVFHAATVQLDFIGSERAAFEPGEQVAIARS